MDYEEIAGKFLDDTGTEIKINFVDTVTGFPFEEDKLQHNHYKVKISRYGNEFEIDYYGSYYDYKNNVAPTYYDILCSLEKYPYSDIWDFASEFGFEIHSREDYKRVAEIFKECKRQYESLSKMYTEDEMERLMDIV